jgi:iron complex transport system substrate-binding protein
MNKALKRILIFAMLYLSTGVSFLCSGCTKKDTAAGTITQNQVQEKGQAVTDMAGRNVSIPPAVKTVYCAVPTAEAMLYSLAPEKMCAWVFQHSPEEEKFLSARVKDLPILGGWMGQKCTANMEEIARQAPDLIVFMTTTGINSDAIQTADTIQAQTKIPVAVMDSNLTATPAAYRKLGALTGDTERAELLASWAEKKLQEVSAMTAKIPDDKLVSVYYAEGNGGLLTDPSGSDHTQVLDFVRGKNVAAVQLKGGQGMSAVSMEQLLLWNPQVILVSSNGNGSAAREKILTDGTWKKLDAVAHRKVYIVPSLPFNWFDRPPDIMRIIGTEWLSQLLYPEYVQVDFKADMKEFYSLFLGITLTDSDIAEIMKDAH